MNRNAFRRAVALSISLSLALLSPGFTPYAAAAALRAAVPARGVHAPIALPMSRVLGGASLSPAATLSSPLMTRPGIAPVVAPALAAPAPAAAENAALAPALTAAPVRPTIETAAAATQETLSALGPIGSAPSAAAADAGRRLEDALLGAAPSPRRADFASAPEARFSARPAGLDISIAAAAADSGDAPPPAPQPNSPRDEGPLFPRLLAAGVAAAPGFFIGLPIYAAGATLFGGLVMAASAGLVLMPLLGSRMPRVLAAAPGVAVAGLAFLTLPFAPWSAALAGLAGWGLANYGFRGPNRRAEDWEKLGAFAGGVGALTAVALSVAGPLGPVGVGFLWFSRVGSLVPLATLPKFVRAGAYGALRALGHGWEGAYRIAGAVKRDTLAYERLTRFSSRMWESWKGNGVWLGILVWGPIAVAHAITYVVATVSGFATGVVQAISFSVWGAIEELWPESKAHVFAAEWGRASFDRVSNGKVRWFNAVERRLLDWANSGRLSRSIPGVAGIRLLELAWLAASPFMAAGLLIGGLFTGLKNMGRKYDAARHLQSSLDIETQDRPADKPKLPDGEEPIPGKIPAAAKAFTAALALAPAVFFGWQLLAGFSIIKLAVFLGAALPLVTIPFSGPSPRAGSFLKWNGIILLLSGQAIWVGLAAALGGWGLSRYAAKAEKERRFDEFDVMTWFGALGTVIAVGAAWTATPGLIGALSFWSGASSLLLMRHLPEWTFAGLSRALRGVWKSGESSHGTLSFWSDGRDGFKGSWEKHWDHWINRHWTHGIWLSVLWAGVLLGQAVDGVLAAAVGVVSGLVRSPFAFLAGAYAESDPRGTKDRFWDGVEKGWLAAAEGSKWPLKAKALVKATQERTEKTGRPTVKAIFAFSAMRFLQILWLAGALAVSLSGAGLVAGVVRGVKDLKELNSGPRPYKASIASLWLKEKGDAVNEPEKLYELQKAALIAHLENFKASLTQSKIPFNAADFEFEKLAPVKFEWRPDNPHMFSASFELTLNGRQADVFRSYAQLEK